MINRVQIGYPAVIKAVVKPKPIEIGNQFKDYRLVLVLIYLNNCFLDEYLPKLVINKKELNWENDMQLKSSYLDKKEELKNEYDQYLHDHPDLKAIMGDYIQSLISFKPNDVAAFSAKYFASYSSKTKPNKLLPSLRQEIYIPKHN